MVEPMRECVGWRCRASYSQDLYTVVTIFVVFSLVGGVVVGLGYF